MNSFFIQLLPLAIFFLSLSVPVAIAMWIRHQRRHRRTPLNYRMLRAPGESTSKRADELKDDLDDYFLSIAIAPLTCYSGYLTAHYVADTKVSPLIFVVLALGVIAFLGTRISKTIRQRHNEILGLDCERAVGQELNQLLLEGCRVYHDFQADKFNIDHIVIGKNGVFAIETKGRAKPNRGKGQEDARVTYDGQYLQFPSWREQEPLEQAKRQAAWLSNWVTKAVGDQVMVKPAVALPGWFVELKKPGIIIFNGRNPQFLSTMNTGTALSPQMIQRIAHQIEMQCRNVDPQAFPQQ